MAMDFRIVQHDCVASTNDEVKQAIEVGEPEGLVVRARMQTGGYGRQGRTWESPEGGLYQSLLLRPQVPMAQLPTLALVAALAVRTAVLQTSGAPERIVQVKWPNDIVIEVGLRPQRPLPQNGTKVAEGDVPLLRGKLAGISCEIHAGGICLGIGVNVLRPQTGALELPTEKTPAYLVDLLQGEALRDCEPSSLVAHVGDAVLEAFAMYYDRWQRAGFAAFADEFAACSSLTGKHVCIADITGAVTVEGTVSGVDMHGRLLVRTASGEIPVTSGEAHLR